MITPRTQTDVQAQFAQAVSALAAEPGSVPTDFSAHDYHVMTGVRDALAWVLGMTPTAPLSGRHAPEPGSRELWREWALADDIVSRPPPAPDGLNWTYVSAIEHALYWARGLRTTPPAEPLTTF
jgi:hypothetical protein